MGITCVQLRRTSPHTWGEIGEKGHIIRLLAGSRSLAGRSFPQRGRFIPSSLWKTSRGADTVFPPSGQGWVFSTPRYALPESSQACFPHYPHPLLRQRIKISYPYMGILYDSASPLFASVSSSQSSSSSSSTIMVVSIGQGDRGRGSRVSISLRWRK